MTTQEYIQNLVSMYGDFTTEGMGRAVVEKIKQLTDSQRQKLFETYCRIIPGNFKPDIKATLEAMDKAGIIPGESTRTCASCGNKWVGTSYCCPRCNYSKEDGDPIAYCNEWLNGTGRFNREQMAKLFENLKQKHSV